MAMFLFQRLLLFWFFFASNCISIDLLFDVINQGIHLEVILTLAKFHPTSAMVLKQNDLKDSIYILNEKKRDFYFEIFIFGFSIYQL